jgi:hypothetical protein
MSDTSPRDQSALMWNARSRQARTPRPGERLYEWDRGGDLFRCELRDHGEFGVEAQVMRNGELVVARTFRDVPDLGLKARALAIAWAEAERKTMAKGGA